MISYWEKKHFFDYDTIIVGSGPMGLSIAASILENSPKKSVVVLERGLFPTGAESTDINISNFGSFSYLLNSIKQQGEAETLAKVKQLWRRAERCSQLLNHSKVELELSYHYEIITNENLDLLAQIDYVNGLLYPIFEDKVFVLANEEISAMNLDGSKVTALIKNQYERHFEAEKLLIEQVKHVQRLGGVILTGADVVSYKQAGKEIQVEIKVPLSFAKENYVFKCGQLILTVNDLKSEEKKSSKQMDVTVTKPVPGLKLNGAFHCSNGKGGRVYWSVVDERVVLTEGPGSKSLTTQNLIDLPLKYEKLEVDTELSSKFSVNQSDRALPSLNFISDNVLQIKGSKNAGFIQAAFYGDVVREATTGPSPSQIKPKL